MSDDSEQERWTDEELAERLEALSTRTLILRLMEAGLSSEQVNGLLDSIRGGEPLDPDAAEVLREICYGTGES